MTVSRRQRLAFCSFPIHFCPHNFASWYVLEQAFHWASSAATAQAPKLTHLPGITDTVLLSIVSCYHRVGLSRAVICYYFIFHWVSVSVGLRGMRMTVAQLPVHILRSALCVCVSVWAQDSQEMGDESFSAGQEAAHWGQASSRITSYFNHHVFFKTQECDCPML